MNFKLKTIDISVSSNSELNQSNSVPQKYHIIIILQFAFFNLYQNANTD